MAMEYFIDVECEMKKTAGGMNALRQYIKKQGVVKMMTEIISQQAPGIDILSQKTVFEVHTPEGVVRKEEATVGQLKEQTDWMYQWTDYCGQCQYAFLLDDNAEKNELCGCYASLSYPISGIAEGVLGMALDAVCTLKKGAEPRRLVEYIMEKGIRGDRIKNMRKNGQFQRDKAISAKVGAFKSVTTDQVYEVLFFSDLTPQFMKEVLLPFMAVVVQAFKEAPDQVRSAIQSDSGTFYLIGMALAMKKASEHGLKVITDA